MHIQSRGRSPTPIQIPSSDSSDDIYIQEILDKDKQIIMSPTAKRQIRIFILRVELNLMERRECFDTCTASSSNGGPFSI